jgi:hypothetical protein
MTKMQRGMKPGMIDKKKPAKAKAKTEKKPAKKSK